MASPGVLESPPLSDIDAEIQRLLSELKPNIQELARKKKELSDAAELYCRYQEAVRKMLFDVGIYQFDEVDESANDRLQRQGLKGRIDEMLSLSDHCTAQIAEVIAAIDIKNKKEQSSSEQLAGSKLGDSSTSNGDVEIGKECLGDAQVILTAAQQSIQDVNGLCISATGNNVNDTEAELGTAANKGLNLSEVECLENRMAEFDIEEEEEDMEKSEEMDVDSDGKIKLKRKNEEEDDDDQKKPKKTMKLKDQNPPARD